MSPFPVRAALAALGLFVASSAANAAIYVDFGDTLTMTANPSYNNFTNTTPNAAIANLVDEDGTTQTGIRLGLTGQSGVASTGGTVTPGLTGDAATAFGGSQFNAGTDYAYFNTAGTITVSNLNPANTYSFVLFSSRNSAGDRTGSFTATGVNSATGTLNATFNTANILALNDIQPTSAGVITIAVARGGSNTVNPIYLNALKISAVPEPATATVLLGGAGLLLLRRRKSA